MERWHGEVISPVVHAHIDADEDIYAFCRLLLPAGAETTYRSSRNLLTGLLTNPDQLDAVRTDRALLPEAIERGCAGSRPC